MCVCRVKQQKRRAHNIQTKAQMLNMLSVPVFSKCRLSFWRTFGDDHDLEHLHLPVPLCLDVDHSMTVKGLVLLPELQKMLQGVFECVQTRVATCRTLTFHGFIEALQLAVVQLTSWDDGEVQALVHHSARRRECAHMEPILFAVSVPH